MTSGINYFWHLCVGIGQLKIAGVKSQRYSKTFVYRAAGVFEEFEETFRDKVIEAKTRPKNN